MSTAKSAHGARNLEPMTEDECTERIMDAPIGRIGFVHDGMPMVVPVNFRWHEDTIVFRTQEGQKLSDSDSRPVCFEIDSWNQSTRTGWSVILQGIAEEVTSWAEKEQLEQIGLYPWTNEVFRRRWVRVRPTEITGRKISAQ